MSEFDKELSKVNVETPNIKANRAFKVEKYKHSYPNCWRTDKPILYYP